MAEELDEGRVAYLEARVGDLNMTVGDLRSERELLLWLHAEAVWQRQQETTRLRARIHEAVDETQRRYAEFQSRCDKIDAWADWTRRFLAEHSDPQSLHLLSLAHRELLLLLIQDREQATAEAVGERSSRQAWAEEAMRLLEVLDRLEQAALNPAALYSGVLVGVGGERDTPPNDEQCHRAAGLIERAIRRAMGPYYVTQAEERLVRAIGEGRVCACVSDEQAAVIEAAGPIWSRPVCSVHPDGVSVPEVTP